MHGKIPRLGGFAFTFFVAGSLLAVAACSGTPPSTSTPGTATVLRSSASAHHGKKSHDYPGSSGSTIVDAVECVAGCENISWSVNTSGPITAFISGGANPALINYTVAANAAPGFYQESATASWQMVNNGVTYPESESVPWSVSVQAAPTPTPSPTPKVCTGTVSYGEMVHNGTSVTGERIISVDGETDDTLATSVTTDLNLVHGTGDTGYATATAYGPNGALLWTSNPALISGDSPKAKTAVFNVPYNSCKISAVHVEFTYSFWVSSGGINLADTWSQLAKIAY